MKMLEALWKYQQVDLKVSAVEYKLKKSETRQKLLKARNYLMDSQKGLKQMEAEAGELRVAFDTASGKVETYTEQVESIEREIREIENTANLADIERLRKEINDLRDLYTKQEHSVQQILDSLTRIDASMSKLYTGIPKAKSDFEGLKKIYDDELAQANTEIQPYKQQLVEMEKEIDPRVMAKYKEIKKTRTNPMAKVSGSQCTGCNMELPGITRKKLAYDSEEILECDNCGRILYIEQQE